MDRFKHHWKRTPTVIRKPAVLIVGGVIVLAGVAMLALPGPGWAAIFLGFAILATEFVVAERAQNWLVGKLKAIVEQFKKLIKKKH